MVDGITRNEDISTFWTQKMKFRKLMKFVEVHTIL